MGEAGTSKSDRAEPPSPGPPVRPAAARRPTKGLKPGDWRIRVERPEARYFRHVGPGLVRAKPAAVEPRTPLARLRVATSRFVFGRPLATAEEIAERLPKWKALATFSSDNLSSVAYATELIMFSLIAAGTGSFWLVMPISGLIVAIFLVIVISYRQRSGRIRAAAGATSSPART